MTEETKLVKSKFVPTHEIDLKSRKMSIDLPKREPIHIINVYANSINLILQLEPISEPDSDPTVFQDN